MSVDKLSELMENLAPEETERVECRPGERSGADTIGSFESGPLHSCSGMNVVNQEYRQ